MDEDEMLRRAIEESLHISNQERDERVLDRLIEAQAIHQSERDARQQRERQQETEDAENEALRAAIIASERLEQDRLRRQREELAQRDASFGNSSRSRNTLARERERTAAAVRTPTANRERSHRRQRNPSPAPAQTAELFRDPRDRRRRRNNPNTPRASPGQAGRTPTPQPIRQRSSRPAPKQQQRPNRRQRNEEPTVLENPGHYSLDDVLQMSTRETSATPAQDEGFNRDELATAIAESAGQNRDDEQEAIDRNVGVPTYEEACKAPMYRAPRGVKYKFQGPNKVEEDGNVTMEIVGEMDLARAMEIANRNVHKTKRRRAQGR